MATRKILTEAGIRAAFAGVRKTGGERWIADGHIPRTHGGLQLRVKPIAALWYWRYTQPGGAKPRIPLGTFTFDKTPGALTIAEARAEAGRLAALYQQPDSRDVRAHLDRQAKRDAAENLAAERLRVAQLEAQAEAGKFTLERLLSVYIAHLRKQGKTSTGAVENCVINHVTKACPSVAQMPANAATARDVAALLRPLTESGKGRTAGKLRSYLRSAFALAARAEVDPDAPSAFLPFRVEGNPAAATGTLAKFNRALDRTLTEPELREYYAALNDAPDSPIRDALLLALLLGGQRTAQLLRATVADVDATAKTLRLFDPKGRRAQPRVHVLPLSEAALVVVNRCIARAEAQRAKAEEAGTIEALAAIPLYLFSTFDGTPLRGETVTNAATEIAAALRAKPKAQRVVKESFQLRDIRRTCETRLAALGVSRDIRAQIQSHGLGGVQGKHYDRHDYMAEKSAALAAWATYLQQKPASNVRQLRG
jgi:integrase